jgi:hypothetical protein
MNGADLRFASAYIKKGLPPTLVMRSQNVQGNVAGRSSIMQKEVCRRMRRLTLG